MPNNKLEDIESLQFAPSGAKNMYTYSWILTDSYPGMLISQKAKPSNLASYLWKTAQNYVEYSIISS